MFKAVNKVIKVYIYWDLVLNSAWGLLGPVFAIFLVQNISGGSLVEGAKVAGFATLFYWITKSIIQVPIGHYLDINHGEYDDFWAGVIGTIITGFVPFGYLLSTTAWEIYALQVIHAIGMALVVPSTYAIFIRHCDKGHEALESSLDSTLLGVGVGITGAIGGITAAYFGFQTIFLLAGVFTIISAFLWLFVREEMAPHDHHKHEIPASRVY